MHAINFNYSLSSFENVWIKNVNRNMNVQLRNDDQFQVIAPNTEWFKRYPLYSLPTEWNNCGLLQSYENPITFYHVLKNKLFDDILLETDSVN